ncbi:MAG TPA: dihydrofolate reductase family protein, partial [Anaerolineales bacterium]|nr:dihydrofolate reductase family protein [Anaerolineales bacterium]
MDFLQGWLDKLTTHAAACLRRHGRPLVTLSYAQSLDGCLTDRRGQPFAISGAGAVDVTHALRAAHHAVLIGAGTALADTPQLNVRRVAGAQPHVVILDTRL